MLKQKTLLKTEVDLKQNFNQICVGQGSKSVVDVIIAVACFSQTSCVQDE